jgi:Flp pilus assembly protein TadD
MLATKNRDGCCAIICAALAVILAGCTPAGPRAVLDGKRLLDAGHCEQAIEKFKVATSLLNTNAQAWNYLGVAWHRAGRLTNALGAYQKALDLNRDLLEARYNLGCLWLDLNKSELAKAELTSTLCAEATPSKAAQTARHSFAHVN